MSQPILRVVKESLQTPWRAVSARGALARSRQPSLAVLFEAALMIALAAGLGFSFGAVIERITTSDPTASTSVVVATDQSMRPLPRPGDFGLAGSVGLGTQVEIGPSITDSRRRRDIHSQNLTDGVAPNEVRLFGE